MKQFVIFLLMAAGSVPAASNAGSVRFEQSLDAMGTTFSVVAYGVDRFQLQSGVAEALEEVRRLDGLLSNYRPESEWSQVNRLAGERPVKVSDELFGLLAACMRYSAESDGAFDITVGPLMRVWGFYRGSGRFPHRAEIKGALSRVGYRNVVLDAKEKTVHFRRLGIELDPGGIGKGYAVERMVRILKAAQIGSAFITAGSSTVYGLGTPPGEARGWRVTIRNPRNPNETVQELFLRDTSMSTSGNYEKFFRMGRRMYSHIMDPRTGYPSEGMLSVSVVTPDALDSEAWTKPYYINGRKWAAEHKLRSSRVYLCEDRSGVACAWLQ